MFYCYLCALALLANYEHRVKSQSHYASSAAIGDSSAGTVVGSGGSEKKIAFLFLTRGPLPLEDIWREFFKWNADANQFSVYVHPHHGFKYPPTSYFYQKEVRSTEKTVSWGGMSQVRAMRTLTEKALEDPDNEWFCLMSESCIPLVPFTTWRSIMMANTKSIINACWLDPAETERETRWKPGLDDVGLKKESWRKSANWFALRRKHAQIFVDERKLEPGFEGVICVDEHYLPTILAHYGLDNETTCTDGLAHVNWPNLMAMHPKTYSPDEVNTELFAYFQTPIGLTPGFSQQCSGFPELCHFTARKFNGNSKHALLENLDLILSDDKHPYTGNPWDHHIDKVRFNRSTTGMDMDYFLIENGRLRQVPDNYTFAHFHITINNDTELKKLSEEDLAFYPLAEPFPTRENNKLVKTRKSREVFVLRNGHKHSLPDLDTFFHLKLKLEDVVVLSDSDMEQIPRGHPIKSVNQ